MNKYSVPKVGILLNSPCDSMGEKFLEFVYFFGVPNIFVPSINILNKNIPDLKYPGKYPRQKYP